MFSVLAKAGPVQMQPFPHVIIRNALPADVYAELARTRPVVTPGPGQVNGPNERIDALAPYLLGMPDLPQIWRGFVGHHVSQAFWQEIATLFGEAIRAVYPRLRQPLTDWKTGVRGSGQTLDVALDCAVGINTPPVEPGTVRGAHVDYPAELFAGLLYMRDPADDSTGGDFVINRLVKQPKLYGKSEVEPDCVTEVARVPYAANTFVGLINTPFSVHSVTPRSPTKYPRQFAVMSAELPFKLFRFKR